MKKYLKFLFFLLIINFFSSNIFAASLIISDEFSIGKRLKVTLSSGEWYLVLKSGDSWYGLNFDLYLLGRVENNEILEIISIGKIDTAGVYESHVNQVVQEITVSAQSGNTETQDRSGTGANAAIGTLCQDLMQLVEDAITANTAAGIPASTHPDVATSSDIIPFNDIGTDQSTIIANAVAYVAAGIGGDPATATAVIEGGVVTNILVSNPGSQYAPAPPPNAVIAAPTSGTQAAATVVIGGQGVHLPTTANLTVGNPVELVIGDGGGQTAKIITLNICNRNKMPIKFKAAIASAQDTITDADYIEFNTTVFGRNAFERTGIIVPDGYYLYVTSGADNVTATAWGIREQV